MNVRRIVAMITALALCLSLTACAKKPAEEQVPVKSGPFVMDVFAPDATLEVMVTLADLYNKNYNKDVQIRITFDTGVMLAAKVEAGYACDIYIANDSTYMDWLDGSKGTDVNPNKNKAIVPESRKDLLTGPAGEEFAEDGRTTTTYTAAITSSMKYPDVAQAFIDFMASELCDETYAMYGFSRL